MKTELLVLLCQLSLMIYACDEPFEGFGTHLGSIDHFASSRPGTVQKVLDKIYKDLSIRYYRTSYESSFSPKANVYEIVCGSSARICSWIEALTVLSKYREKSVFASIWSPPSRMKTITLQTIPTTEERNFYHFITNVTQLIRKQFDIEIERISPVNEPENVVASWEHTNMLPDQLCRMVKDFSDARISICPENAYFGTSLIYANANAACLDACKVIATHAYDPVFDQDFSMKAHYDLTARDRKIPQRTPIWQTEVSTTISTAAENQMQDALDLAINAVNYVGYTCVRRYYLWSAYTLHPSGESLIWGDANGDLTLPKKYFAYKHFTLAASDGAKMVNKVDSFPRVSYLIFGGSKAVFVNNLNVVRTVNGSVCSELICTTKFYDWNPLPKNATIVVLPPKSVCSCTLTKV